MKVATPCKIFTPLHYCQLPTANCRLKTANCRLKTANCRLITAHFSNLPSQI